jgi:hypothetical protein
LYETKEGLMKPNPLDEAEPIPLYPLPKNQKLTSTHENPQ